MSIWFCNSSRHLKNILFNLDFFFVKSISRIFLKNWFHEKKSLVFFVKSISRIFVKNWFHEKKSLVPALQHYCLSNVDFSWSRCLFTRAIWRCILFQSRAVNTSPIHTHQPKRGFMLWFRAPEGNGPFLKPLQK